MPTTEFEIINDEAFASIQASIPVAQLFHGAELRSTVNRFPVVGQLFPNIEAVSRNYPKSVQTQVIKVLDFLLPPEKRDLTKDKLDGEITMQDIFTSWKRSLINLWQEKKRDMRVVAEIKLSDQRLTYINFGFGIMGLEGNKFYTKIDFLDKSVTWQFFDGEFSTIRGVIADNNPLEEQLMVADCLMKGTWPIIKPGI